MTKQIRVALIGIGNCASSLVQGIFYYHTLKKTNFVPGLLHPTIGSYQPSDIHIVLGFDIDKRKVGKPVSEAIFAEPNVATKFAEVLQFDAPVLMGPILDGYASHMGKIDPKKEVFPSSEKPVNVAKKFKDYNVDVVVNYLPVGSKEATEFYAQAAIDAGCAFVNCMPIFIGSDEKWVQKFAKANLPVLGDDVKSQLGATWMHRMVIQSCLDRGIKINFTKQENFGGNTDFLNMASPERIKTKLISKKSSIEHLIQDHPKGGYPIPPVYAGPGSETNNHGYIASLNDKKIAHILVEGNGFGGIPLSIQINLEVEDSPNSAGVVIDAIRCAKLALDRKISGAISSASAFFFKHPYKKITDQEAIKRLELFIQNKLKN
ncbi:MAG: inositol-3-phosphate synthase [Candidatus Nanoarchaeia archaeon]